MRQTGVLENVRGDMECPVSGQAVGIDVGGTNLRAALVDADGRVLERVNERVQKGREAFAHRIEEIVRALDRSAVRPVGIGLPGRIDVRANAAVTAGYLDIAGLPFPEMLGAERGRVVRLDNDAAMALRAEMMVGAAHGLSNVVMFTIGTGIGGAVALDGRLVHGHAFAGQLGHITVDASGGELCNCGRRGCVETTSSGSALGRLLVKADLPHGTTARDLIARAREGDDQSLDILRTWANPLQFAIETIVAVVDPELVVIGGGLGRDAASALALAPRPASWFNRPIVAARLEDDAGVIGAALCALEAAAGRAPPRVTT
jgi:glucokinase